MGNREGYRDVCPITRPPTASQKYCFSWKEYRFKWLRGSESKTDDHLQPEDKIGIRKRRVGTANVHPIYLSNLAIERD